MRSSRQRQRTVRAAVAVVVALAVHGAGLAIFGAVYDPPKGLPPGMAPVATNAAESEGPPIEITNLVDELERPDVRTAEEKRREEEKKKEEENKAPPGQVVDIAKPALEQRPDKADFLAEYDSKVDKQTKGKAGNGQAGGKEQPTPPAVAVQKPNPKQQQEAMDQPLPQGAGMGGGRPGPLAMRDLGKAAPETKSKQPGEIPEVDAKGAGEYSKAGTGGAPQKTRDKNAAEAGQQADGPLGVPTPPSSASGKQLNLQPTTDALNRAIGVGPGSVDFLRDVDDGDATALNAKKWKHAPFFNRVKRAVAQEWHPDMVYIRNDPRGNVWGVKDRVTVLRVRIDGDGKLLGSQVMQSSGVTMLDEEAQEAFKRAAPFPNPPKDLINGTGEIQFNFGFIFELSGRSNVKFFKYQ